MSRAEEKVPSTPSMRLDGQVALVTGAGRGIGRGCALALGEAGAHVVALSRTAADLDAVCGEIRSRGGDAVAAVCDITDSGTLAQTMEGLERLDILVNNAGTNIPKPMVAVREEDLDTMLELNVRAAYLVAQIAARKMIAGGRGGSIIHMSSQMGRVGAANRTVYCMTKHAIEGLTKAMAVELAPHGIRVNAVAPTFIETPLTRPFFEAPEFKADTLRRIPLGRFGKISDVMGAVVFLASPAAAMVTGASLLVDGGWTAQ